MYCKFKNKSIGLQKINLLYGFFAYPEPEEWSQFKRILLENGKQLAASFIQDSDHGT